MKKFILVAFVSGFYLTPAMANDVGNTQSLPYEHQTEAEASKLVNVESRADAISINKNCHKTAVQYHSEGVAGAESTHRIDFSHFGNDEP